jgi:hypothetical protein
MTARLFTPAEVNSLLPRLAPLIEQAMDRHRQASALQHRLGEERSRIRDSGGGLVDQREWKARAERLDGLGIEIRALLQEVLELGGVTKDLDLGLVDFPGMIGGETVNLCWKAGEPEVRFWHGLDEGYAKRKPLP